MKQGTSRKITIIVLVALTALLGILAFVIAMRLREAQAPVDTSAASTACPADKPVFCAGCLNKCYSYTELGTQTCNMKIDAECQQTGCAGQGVYAGGQSCCAGLTLCANGRCDTGCGTQNATGTQCDPATGKPDGCACSSNSQCSSGVCGAGGACRAASDPCAVTSNKPNGCACTSATANSCTSGTCLNNLCQDSSVAEGPCGTGQCLHNGGTSYASCLNISNTNFVGACSAYGCSDTQRAYPSGKDSAGACTYSCAETTSCGSATGTNDSQNVANINPTNGTCVGSCCTAIADGCAVFLYTCPDGAVPCTQNGTSHSGTYCIPDTVCDGSAQLDVRCNGGTTVAAYTYVINPVCEAEGESLPICNQACTDTCGDGTECRNGTCQNPLCLGDSDCVCTSSSSSTTTTTSTGTYACVEMTNQGGASTIAPGQVIYFTERYSTTYATCPFTQSAVRLLVSSSGTTATGVGGAYNNGNTPTSLLVPAVSLSTSSSGGTLYCDYNFVWQATNTNGTDVADGNYQVHFLTNTSDSSKVTTPVACVESLTVDSEEEISPAFTLLKSSSAVCLDNGGATINYTVTARNVSSVSGALDRVTDDLPSEILDSQVSNISDSGVLSNGIITWTGPYTLAAGASRSFTYRATLTEAQVIALDEAPIYNRATIIYDTPSTQDNSIDFDLATYVTCLPHTGLFDSTEGLVLIGFILIIGGILFNRTGMAVVIAESGVGRAIGNLTSQVGSYESKVERAQEKKIKNRRK